MIIFAGVSYAVAMAFYAASRVSAVGWKVRIFF